MPYNYSIYEDIDLLEMVTSHNDELAFKEIYLRYADPLFRVAFCKTNNKEAAEDVIQITFVKLWSRRDKLKINHSLKAYLYTAVKRNVISYYLRQLPKQTVSLDASHEELPAQYNTEQSVSYSDTLALYNESLEGLPDKCREVFVLSRDGYSLKEIADIKHISPKTAEVHIGKALRHLRKKMKGYHNLFLLALYFI